MRLKRGYKEYETINLNGEEYIKLKDVNEIVLSCYHNRMQKGLVDVNTQFNEFIENFKNKGFDIEEEIARTDFQE